MEEGCKGTGLSAKRLKGQDAGNSDSMEARCRCVGSTEEAGQMNGKHSVHNTKGII